RAVTICAAARRRHALADVKLVLITNGSLLLDDAVRGALAILCDNNGEIWAKLDAGTEEYYGRVNRSGVPFASILDNLTETARRWPLVIQTLFMRLDGRPPSDDELSTYARRLRGIVDAGGRIDRVQIHTVARPPVESWVAPLADDQIDAIGDRLRRATGLVVETFHA
ncbi:MAG: radical SAM protein, partial [Pirellulales bacterium]|nr:radical SAM protein [Pirellulales bacterium]